MKSRLYWAYKSISPSISNRGGIVQRSEKIQKKFQKKINKKKITKKKIQKKRNIRKFGTKHYEIWEKNNITKFGYNGQANIITGTITNVTKFGYITNDFENAKI